MKNRILTSLMGLLLVASQAHAWEGKATFYTEASCKSEGTSGVWTANGERFDEQAMTCALPIRLKYGKSGAEYVVSNQDENSPHFGETIVVRHNDFGPGKGPRNNGVVIDLTPKAFEALGGKIVTLKNGRQVGMLPRVSIMEVK